MTDIDSIRHDAIDVRSDTQFQELESMIQKGPVTFILIYADWCEHSRKYLPLWHALGRTPGRTANMASIHYDMARIFPLIAKAEIEGYPTVIKVGTNNTMEICTTIRDVPTMEKELTGQHPHIEIAELDEDEKKREQIMEELRGELKDDISCESLSTEDGEKWHLPPIFSTTNDSSTPFCLKDPAEVYKSSFAGFKKDTLNEHTTRYDSIEVKRGIDKHGRQYYVFDDKDQPLYVVVFKIKDAQLICLNDTIMPLDDFLSIAYCNTSSEITHSMIPSYDLRKVPGISSDAIDCVTVSGRSFRIPNATIPTVMMALTILDADYGKRERNVSMAFPDS